MDGEVVSVVVVPYYCGMGDWNRTLLECLQEPERIDIRALTEQTEKYASDGVIDPTSYMLNDRVFIYHSPNDSLVAQGHSIWLLLVCTNDRYLKRYF